MPPRAVADPRVLLLHGEGAFLVGGGAKRDTAAVGRVVCEWPATSYICITSGS